MDSGRNVSPARPRCTGFRGLRQGVGLCWRRGLRTLSPGDLRALVTTGHARILHRPGAIEARDIPLPLGLTTADISYIVGGFRWKALFLDRQGYLVTSSGSGPGANQFNLQGRHWVDFRPGEKVPYDCGRCHTTGYAAEGHQDGLPGIVGTWRLDGVQCEHCHGPGARHARSSLRQDIRHPTRRLCLLPPPGVEGRDPARR